MSDIEQKKSIADAVLDQAAEETKAFGMGIRAERARCVAIAKLHRKLAQDGRHINSFEALEATWVQIESGADMESIHRKYQEVSA